MSQETEIDEGLSLLKREYNTKYYLKSKRRKERFLAEKAFEHIESLKSESKGDVDKLKRKIKAFVRNGVHMKWFKEIKLSDETGCKWKHQFRDDNMYVEDGCKKKECKIASFMRGKEISYPIKDFVRRKGESGFCLEFSKMELAEIWEQHKRVGELILCCEAPNDCCIVTSFDGGVEAFANKLGKAIQTM